MKKQFHPTKLSLVVASVLTLNGCIEVDDDSNNDLTAAVQQQNQILTQQLEQSQQTNTVTFSALIVDGTDATPMSSALITVKTVSATVVENQAVDAGKFTVSNLPANSTVEMIVSSSDDSFMTRVFYFNTGDSTSGVAEKDFGKFEVSAGKEYSIIVTNGETNMPVAGLEFVANSNRGNGSSENDYLHTSTYDDVNGEYKITLPRHLLLEVTASIDADKDGERDFELENSNYVSGTNIRLFSSQIEDLDPLLTSTPLEVLLEDVQFRISILDSSASSLQTAMVSVDDTHNDITVEVDAESGQYVIDAKVNNNIQFDIPAFEENGANYQSASIFISERNDTQYQVSVSNGSGNSFYTIDKADVLDLVIQPRETTQSSTELEILAVGNPTTASNNHLSVFYSSAVTVAQNNVSLFNIDAVTVTRGNASNDDTILSGTTSVVGGEFVDITSTMSLNDTKLTLTPDAALSSDTRYRYNVGNVRIQSNEFDTDLFEDNNVQFTTAISVSDTPFDISMLTLDNNSYTTNGAAIVAQNTAGVAANPSDFNRTVYLYLPEEINQLKTLTVNQVSYISDNTVFNQLSSYNIVANGSLNSGSKIFALNVADNENVQRSNTSLSIVEGTTLTEGIHYRSSSLEWLSDNTDTQTNSITFEYAYETKAGEVTTGTITLPVL